MAADEKQRHDRLNKIATLSWFYLRPSAACFSQLESDRSSQIPEFCDEPIIRTTVKKLPIALRHDFWL
jgi:hypothetical protein